MQVRPKVNQQEPPYIVHKNRVSKTIFHLINLRNSKRCAFCSFQAAAENDLFPGGADFVVVLNNVLVGAVKSDGERRAGAAGCSLEPCVAGNHVIRQDAAVAPSADAELVGIGDAHLDDMIDSGLQILDFVMAPVGKNSPRILCAAARTAAIVHCQHGIPFAAKNWRSTLNECWSWPFGPPWMRSSSGTFVPAT